MMLTPPDFRNLPAVDARHQELQEVLPSLPRTVLQIEDNVANAEVVEQLIARRSDLKLLTATNAHQGIEMACQHLPDLILMDMRLPDFGGIAALAILRANPATAHIPVIALSSNAYPNEIQKCQKAGAFQYLTKSFRLGELMDAIDDALLLAAAICLTK